MSTCVLCLDDCQVEDSQRLDCNRVGQERIHDSCLKRMCEACDSTPKCPLCRRNVTVSYHRRDSLFGPLFLVVNLVVTMLNLPLFREIELRYLIRDKFTIQCCFFLYFYLLSLTVYTVMSKVMGVVERRDRILRFGHEICP
jgi:hypothetical protein